VHTHTRAHTHTHTRSSCTQLKASTQADTSIEAEELRQGLDVLSSELAAEDSLISEQQEQIKQVSLCCCCMRACSVPHPPGNQRSTPN